MSHGRKDKCFLSLKYKDELSPHEQTIHWVCMMSSPSALFQAAQEEMSSVSGSSLPWTRERLWQFMATGQGKATVMFWYNEIVPHIPVLFRRCCFVASFEHTTFFYTLQCVLLNMTIIIFILYHVNWRLFLSRSRSQPILFCWNTATRHPRITFNETSDQQTYAQSWSEKDLHVMLCSRSREGFLWSLPQELFSCY